MTSLDEAISDAVTKAVEAGLARGCVNGILPYPVGVSLDEAARLLSVSRSKVRQLLAEDRIRRLDLGDNDTPRSRVVIATVSLFELDPGVTTDRLAEVFHLDRDRGDVA